MEEYLTKLAALAASVSIFIVPLVEVVKTVVPEKYLKPRFYPLVAIASGVLICTFSGTRIGLAWEESVVTGIFSAMMGIGIFKYGKMEERHSSTQQTDDNRRDIEDQSARMSRLR